MAYEGARKDSRPLLPVGMHRSDLPGLQRLCVDYFVNSTTRANLMASLGQLVGAISRSGIPGSVWIGGSFLTDVFNPREVEVALVLVDSVYRHLTGEQMEFFNWFAGTDLADKYGCNAYGLVIDAEREDGEALLRYWLRQYGLSGDGGQRCMVELSVPILVRHEFAA